MANNEIGYANQNDANRREALKKLEYLKKLQKEMNKRVVIEVIDGRKTIREYYSK